MSNAIVFLRALEILLLSTQLTYCTCLLTCYAMGIWLHGTYENCPRAAVVKCESKNKTSYSCW